MTDSPKDIWFPAKKYGWGWGLPITWQGWLVLVGYFIIVTAFLLVVNPAQSPIKFYLSIAMATVILLCICFAKGEKPKWRWGDSDK